MNHTFQSIFEQIKTNRAKRKKWLTIAVSLCVLVAIGTAYLLINPADTQAGDTFCGFEEHIHTEECYETADNPETGQSEQILVCEAEEHNHSLQCFSNPDADTEDSAAWENSVRRAQLSGNWNKNVISVANTQLGYTESSLNYQVREDGVTTDGYTRYGAWAQSPYADWSAAFCSFCLNYSGIDLNRLPLALSCQEWVHALSDPSVNLYHQVPSEGEGEAYTPVPGDLVFFNSGKSEDRTADRVGFVAEVICSESGKISKIKTIEGDSDNTVRCSIYDAEDTAILGYGQLPENPDPLRTIESAPASNGAVAVITGELPEGAEAVIEAVSLSGEELAAYVGEAQAALMKEYVAYDIKVMVAGEEWQPNDTVSVTVRQSELTAGDANFGVAHIDDETNEVSELSGEITEDGEIRFDTDGFSLYIFYTFTVDFHYGDITFSINGMSSILLQDLFDALEIHADAANVAELVFSDETLVNVQKDETGAWMLVSLKPFTTDETLTVTFGDGTELVIAVTDAQLNNNSPSVRWNSDGTISITISGTSSSGNGKGKTVKLQYSTNNGSSYSDWLSTTSSNSNKTFTLNGSLADNKINGNVTASTLKFRLLDDGTAYDTTWTLMDLLGKINKPSSQTDSFSTWLASYTGNKSTLSDVLTAYGKYYNGETPGGDEPGPDDPGDDPVDPPVAPEGISVAWNENQKKLFVSISRTATTTASGVKMSIKASSATGSGDSWYTFGTAFNMVTGQKYSISVEIPSNQAFAGNVWTIGAMGSGTTLLEDYTNLFGGGSDGKLMYRLFDLVPIDTEPYGYSSSSFSQWVANEYVGNPLYGNPSKPTSWANNTDGNGILHPGLATVFHFYYTGKYPIGISNGTFIEESIVPAQTMNLSFTALNEDAKELKYSELGGDNNASVAKKIDWLGDDNASKKDLYRLYLDFKAEVKPIDLLLVVDQSGSMQSTPDGGTAAVLDDSKQGVLLQFLDGEKEDGARTGGFIQNFLGTADNRTENNLAIVTFGSDSNTVTADELADSDVTRARYIRPWDYWDSCEDDIFVSGLQDSEDALSSVSSTLRNQATNYAAAYQAANEIWAEHDAADSPLKDNDHYKVMIFLSDGEPTVAYADGKMHTSFDSDEIGTFVVGTGGAGSASIDSRLSGFMPYANADALEVKAGRQQPSYNQNRMDYISRGSLEDDAGNIAPTIRWMFTNTNTVPSFPLIGDISTLNCPVPGLTSLMGSFTDTDASTFLEWFVDPPEYIPFMPVSTNVNSHSGDYFDINNWAIGGVVDGEWMEPHATSISGYNLFELSKSAFAEFTDIHSDVTNFSIGFGSGINSTYPNGIAQDSVLKYMSGEANYKYCTDTYGLNKFFNEITQMKDVVMTDVLSDNVTPADAPDLVITLKQGIGTNATTKTLVQNGALTADGQNMLNVTSVSDLFKTVNDKTVLQVPFKDTVIFTNDIELSAEFTVQTTPEATQKYINNGYRYDAVGDYEEDENGNLIPITDHDTRDGHLTSSNLPGLYSNLEKTGDTKTGVTWTHMGERDLPFPRPVVQLAEEPENPWGPIEPIEPVDPSSMAHPDYHKTIDYLGNNDNSTDQKNPDTALDDTGVSGLDDAYRLYLDVKDITDPVNLLLVIDRSNSMYNNSDMLIDPSGGADDTDNKQTRMAALLQFLNGTKADCSDGFIQQFLAANENNQIAAVSFGSDAGIASGDNSDYLIDWTKTYADTSGNTKKLSIPQYSESDSRGATNYASAYYLATQKLDELVPAANSKTYVLFLTDGVPTIAYTDGAMRNGLTTSGNSKIFGSGNDCRYRSSATPMYMSLLVMLANRDKLTKDDFADLHTTGQFIDHLENSVGIFLPMTFRSFEYYNYSNDMSSALGADEKYGFPVGYTYDIDSTDFSTIGVELINDVNTGKEIFKVTSENVFDEATSRGIFDSYYGPTQQQYEYLLDLSKDFYDLEGPYDLFNLTKSAYDTFINTVGEDVSVISLGFSSELSKEYTDMFERTRKASEVLAYMSKNSGPNGGYIYAPTAQAMAEEVNKLFLIKNPTITDELSSDVDVHSTPDLLVYRQKQGGEKEYLYQNGVITTAGESILSSVSLTPAVRNTSGEITTNGKLVVDFLDSFALDKDYTYTASFNIKVEESTKESFTGTYPDTGDYEVQIDENGDPVLDENDQPILIPITDRTSAITSSGQPGYYSNTAATLTWGPDPNNPVGTRTYPKPVVQVLNGKDIKLKKVDSEDAARTLIGAEFDLYREVSATDTYTIRYTDANNTSHYLLKINTSALAVADDGTVTVTDLKPATYYLYETKAPKGYMLPSTPISFELNSGGIVCTDSRASVDAADSLLLAVKNTAGYEMPQTGGIGTTPYTICGLSLLTAAVYIYALRRKRERRVN